MINYNIDDMEDDVKKYIERHGYTTRHLPFNFDLYDLLSKLDKSYISYLPRELINYIINEYLYVEEQVVDVALNEDFVINNDDSIYLIFVPFNSVSNKKIFFICSYTNNNNIDNKDFFTHYFKLYNYSCYGNPLKPYKYLCYLKQKHYYDGLFHLFYVCDSTQSQNCEWFYVKKLNYIRLHKN